MYILSCKSRSREVRMNGSILTVGELEEVPATSNIDRKLDVVFRSWEGSPPGYVTLMLDSGSLVYRVTPGTCYMTEPPSSLSSLVGILRYDDETGGLRLVESQSPIVRGLIERRLTIRKPIIQQMKQTGS